ncbi:hypothetical protein BKA66DRAFT_584319 [Pyrenochaeta sp. MPI-SDFR-AT-0127]|nr:hypothetical protein BKA66DRAFT_584319 [Pyrenochaeta sp. MPI-SDFR-AT-0127]
MKGTQSPLSQGAGRHSFNCRQSMTQDLYSMIDEYLAWQYAQAKHQQNASSDTVIVDWDGSGLPKITYRLEDPFLEPSMIPAPLHISKGATTIPRTHDAAVSSPTRLKLNAMQKLKAHAKSRKVIKANKSSGCVSYRPSHSSRGRHTPRPAYIGHESQYSEFYVVDAVERAPNVPNKAFNDDVLEEKGKGKNLGRVVHCLHNLLGKLEKLEFKGKRKVERQQSIARRSWVGHGANFGW